MAYTQANHVAHIDDFVELVWDETYFVKQTLFALEPGTAPRTFAIRGSYISEQEYSLLRTTYDAGGLYFPA